MIIQINDTNKIVAFFEDGLIKADNETTFSIKNFKGFVKGRIAYYNKEQNQVYYKTQQVDSEKLEAAKTRRAELAKAMTQKETALQWLADNDWKVNKRTVGEWAEDDPRWLEYLTGRAKMRALYDEAVAILNQK